MPLKNIVIDARLYGPKHTGIGRYTKNLLIALSDLPQFSKYRFTVVTYNDLRSDIQADLGNKFQYVFTDIPHYSLLEQIKFPSLLNQLHPDLVHFTHFNKPFLYSGKSVVTIHDLIKHYFHGPKTTTRNPFLYWPKYWLYRLLTDHVIKTNPLIVPTVYWQKKLATDFNLKPTQITVTQEAVDPKFLHHQAKSVSGGKLKIENYLVYTGNLYPHKNLIVLLQALKFLPDIKLKIISARNFFTDKLQSQIKSLNLQSQVEFLGYLTDAEFSQVYSHALALVHPSLMEGFSLTGLEAMALNCPVISSNASCLPEVYGQSVLYFDPFKPMALVDQIKKLQASDTLRQKLIKLGQLQVAKYSWTKTAQKTMAVYEKLLT
ncbi:MAG: glycosyltransferase family 1 protein [Candidatus Shapirobacteria bacterium]